MKQGSISRFHNPDPLVRLIGEPNETYANVEGLKTKVLLDSGAQLSSITSTKVKELNLEIKKLHTILDLEGTGGGEVPYEGYVELNLDIPEVKKFQEDVLMLVIKDSKYGERVPIAIGTLHLDMILDLATEEELENFSRKYRRGALGRKVAMKQNMLSTEEPPFDLTSIAGEVKITKDVTIRPFYTVRTSAKSKVRHHYKNVNIITEDRTQNTQELPNVAVVPCYGTLKQGSDRVPIVLKNLTCKPITLKKGQVVAEVGPANAVPHMLAPKEDEKEKGNSEEPVADRVKKLFEKLDLSGLDSWPQEDQEKAKKVLEEYQDIFALKDSELGHTKLTKHEIKLVDHKPFKERYRRIPPQQFEEVRKHLEEMINIGAIRKSQSPWASAIVLVRKKDGSLRFCIDLRKLNERTIKDAYSLPRIEESLDCLNGAQIFSSIDLKSGYWQVELTEESKAMTAFTVGPLGFYECVRMPFGLTNAPATFQRLMESCLGEMHLNWCIIYLDDIIVFSKSREEHLERLKGVFQKLREAGLKLKPSKCEFFRDKIAYLGHIVSKAGVETDPKKIQDIADWVRPKTVTDVRQFLGFTNYYRKFIKQYAQVANPLNKLISGDNAKKKNKKVEWTVECEEAFEKLKEICTQTPVLAYADYKRPFKLTTDASKKGLGAVLSQVGEDGKERPVAFASRTLNKAEKNYTTHKLEFLALKWSITDRFHEYLYGSTFEVFTDNNPLSYVLSSAKLDATGQRWIASLQGPYNFKIHYKPGRLNQVADALSRIDRDETETLTELEIQTILDSGGAADVSIPLINEQENGVPLCMKSIQMSGVGDRPWKDWQDEQLKDVGIQPVLLWKQGKRSPITAKDHPAAKQLYKQRKNLQIQHGLLYRVLKNRKTGQETLQFVLPYRFRKRALQACHDEFGHQGMDKTTLLLQKKFFWNNLVNETREHIRNCGRCLTFKKLEETPAMEWIETSYPLELVHLDFLTIGQKGTDEQGEKKKPVNILVATDHFTRFSQAYVTTNQTAITVAKTLWDKFITQYGWPEKILTDQGQCFEAEIIKSLCKEAKIEKIRTCPYHPQGNGQVERFNKTLLNMIGTIEPTEKVRWKDKVQALTHAYNCTSSTTTGYSPYFLFYGREPRIPIDVEFGLPDTRTQEKLPSYVKNLKQTLEEAYQIAKENNAIQMTRHSKYADRRQKCTRIEPGDLVLMRIKALGRDYKVADKWESVPYRVLNQYGKKPVFMIQSVRERGDKNVKTIHRSMLFPLTSPQFENLMDQDHRTQALVKSNLLMAIYFNRN